MMGYVEPFLLWLASKASEFVSKIFDYRIMIQVSIFIEMLTLN